MCYWRKEETGRLERRSKQLLNRSKETRRYCGLKEEALDRIVWWTCIDKPMDLSYNRPCYEVALRRQKERCKFDYSVLWVNEVITYTLYQNGSYRSYFNEIRRNFKLKILSWFLISAQSVAFPNLRPVKNSQLAQPVTALSSLRTAPGSNPGHETRQSRLRLFRGFYSVSPGHCRVNASYQFSTTFYHAFSRIFHGLYSVSPAHCRVNASYQFSSIFYHAFHNYHPLSTILCSNAL